MYIYTLIHNVCIYISVLRQIPNAVNQRINKLSSCKKIFEENKSRYDDALEDSVFQVRLEYLTLVDLISRVKNNNGGTRTLIKVGEIINNISHEKRQGKNRNRKVVWFNPPFCRLANINIGQYFLHLLDKHFNRDNPLSRIFNRNTAKISYSCTKNMYNILSNYNKRLLNELITRDRNPDVESCNCRNKEVCPDSVLRKIKNRKAAGLDEIPQKYGRPDNSTTYCSDNATQFIIKIG